MVEGRGEMRRDVGRKRRDEERWWKKEERWCEEEENGRGFVFTTLTFSSTV